MSFRSTIILSMTMMMLFGVFRSQYVHIGVQQIIHSYDGVVVGKLPFQPFSLIRGILHGRLRGTDYTDLAMVYYPFYLPYSSLCRLVFISSATWPSVRLYVLLGWITYPLSISFYLQIKMILGTQGPRGSQSIFPSMEEMEEKVEKMYK